MKRRFRINVLLGGFLAALVMVVSRWLENSQSVPGAMENGRYVTVVILFAFMYHYVLQFRSGSKEGPLPFIRVLLSSVGFMLSIWSVFVILQAAALYLAPSWLDSPLVLGEVRRVADYYTPDQIRKYAAQIRWQEFFVQETLTLAGGLFICIAIAVTVPNRAKAVSKQRR